MSYHASIHGYHGGIHGGIHGMHGHAQKAITGNHAPNHVPPPPYRGGRGGWVSDLEGGVMIDRSQREGGPARIPARPTMYRGIAMRSRLEARAAGILDQLDLEWCYEPHCFADGLAQYLPDFELWPGNNPHCYVEVKPSGAHSAMDKMRIILASEPEATLALWIPDDGQHHFGIMFVSTLETRRTWEGFEGLDGPVSYNYDDSGDPHRNNWWGWGWNLDVFPDALPDALFTKIP